MAERGLQRDRFFFAEQAASPHALFKALVLGWPGAIRLFASTGMPRWMAYPTVAAELIGGAALILGIGARWAAWLLAPTLIGASAFVHGSHGWIYTSPGDGWEYQAVLLFISAAVVLLGNGALSLQDRLAGLFRRTPRAAWSTAGSAAQ